MSYFTRVFAAARQLGAVVFGAGPDQASTPVSAPTPPDPTAASRRLLATPSRPKKRRRAPEEDFSELAGSFPTLPSAYREIKRQRTAYKALELKSRIAAEASASKFRILDAHEKELRKKLIRHHANRIVDAKMEAKRVGVWKGKRMGLKLGFALGWEARGAEEEEGKEEGSGSGSESESEESEDEEMSEEDEDEDEEMTEEEEEDDDDATSSAEVTQEVIVIDSDSE